MNLSTDSTREILKKVRQIEIRTRRFVTESMIGAYHSVFKGQGIDFEEVREYSPGDDVRSIDWNVTAKMDRPFIKTYKEERELTIMLIVDLSASGEFGSNEQSKRELLAELASVLAFSASRNNDKIGLLLFTDTIEKFIFPRKGRQHILRVIREILFFKPKNKGTDIPMAMNYLNKIIRRKSVVFLLSDFLENDLLNNPFDFSLKNIPLIQSISLTNKRHDLICVDCSDPREIELPQIGIINLEDAESGEIVEIDTSNLQLLNAYNIQNKSRQLAFEHQLRQLGVDHITVSTNRPYITSLREFFQRRERRR